MGDSEVSPVFHRKGIFLQTMERSSTMKIKQREEKLAVSVGIALTAGMFSVIPVVHGAPIHDSASSYNTGAAVEAGTVTTVTGNQQNNVVAWTDFSVSKGESVIFEGNKNYLNIVTGQNTSRIDGTISGGNQVYLINPNGVIMGKDASVKTGSFYASTRYVSPDTAMAAVNAGDMSAVLDGSRTLASDIVNLGTIEADKVVVEGKNIRFLDSDSVKANSVTFQANETDGSIHVGNSAGKTVASYSGNKSIDYYQTISSMAEVTDMSGNYMLSDNITGGAGVEDTYKGKFDGMGFTITNMKTDEGGLFKATDGATIENVGVVDSKVSGEDGTGAIAGTANNTTFCNVFNKNTTIIDEDSDETAGGLVGVATGTVSIKNSYNTGTVNNGRGNGIIGIVMSGTAAIDSSYSTGKVDSGFTNAIDGAKAKVSNSYAVASKGTITDVDFYSTTIFSKKGDSYQAELVYDSRGTLVTGNFTSADFQKASTFASIFGADSISNTGGVTCDSTGNVSRPTWRIYEGQGVPVLTSQLKGITTVNYSYTLGEQSGQNNGADVKDLTYSAASMTAADVTFGAGVSTATIASNVRDAGTKALIYDSQDGWDIVGGTVTIDPKQVSFSGGNFSVDREYDGTTDATEAFRDALTNGGLNASGIYAADKDSVGLDTSKITAAYDSKNVGDRTVTATGTIGINSSNYVLENNGKLDGLTGITGKITPRTLYVTSNADGSIEKFYDGSSAVKNLTLKDGKSSLFELDESDEKHKKVDGDSVALIQASTDTLYYVNAAKEEEKNVVDGMSVVYTGLELTGDDKDNYVLAYKDSNNTITGITNSTVYLEGQINRRTISADDFKVQKDGVTTSISKVYDGNSDFTLDDGMSLINDSTAASAGTTNDDGTGILSVDKDKLHFALTGTGKFYAADGTTETADASDNTMSAKQAAKVGYDVQVSADDTALLNNYQIVTAADKKTLSNYTADSGSSISVLGDGTITRRSLSVGLLKDIKDVNKVYDGTTAVEDGALSFGTDVGYQDGSERLVSGDESQLGFIIQAEYNTKDVARDADRKVIDNGKTVKISLGLDGDAALAGNYLVNGSQGESLLPADTNALFMGNGTGTITPRLLNVTFDQLDKTFDNSAALLKDNSSNISFTGEDNSGVVDSDAAALGVSYAKAYYADENNTEAKNATSSGLENSARKICYEGVSLTGDARDNYELTADACDGAGNILTKSLTDQDVSVTFADTITKVYDTTNSVAYNHTGNPLFFDGENGKADSADYVKGITIDGIALTADKDYTITSAVYNSAGIDADTATYQFHLTGDVLANFDLSQLTNTLYDSANGILTKSTSEGVSITPKQLHAALTDSLVGKGPAYFVKTYDGKDTLAEDQLQDVGLENIIQLDGVIHENGDTTTLDTSRLNGRYADKNVAYDTAGEITNKEVRFDVVLTGSGSGNYVINDTNSSTATLSDSTLGKITPQELTADFTFTEREYKGSNKADAPVTGVKLVGVADGDTITLASSDITGLFGSLDADGNFIANGDVNYDESAAGKAGYKGVQYSGLATALSNAEGTIHGNYTIADTVYFAEAAQKGRIKRLALTQNDIEAVFKDPITKEYDGTSAVLDPEKYFAIRTKDKIDGEYVEFKVSHTDDWAKYYTDATYSNEQINVSDSSTVKFEVNGLAADDILHNFDITDLTDNAFQGTYETTGTITPRVLKLDLTQPDGWVKTYDGTTVVKDADGNAINSFAYTFAEGHDILEADRGTVNVTVTGSYKDADANIGAQDALEGGKDITYTIHLTDSAAVSNYKLENAGVSGTADTTATGSGDIRKREVYVDYRDTTGAASLDSIDKIYDGTQEVKNLSDYTANFYVESQGANTGLIDAGVDLDTDGITAEYESPDVRYDGNNPTAQEVTFHNFALNDTDKAKNYEVVVRQDKGSGVIRPKEINVLVDNAALIGKDYDGTRNLGENQAEIAAGIAAIKNGIQINDSDREVNVVTGTKDTINLTITDASYGQSDASENPVTLDYTLGWDNRNYKLSLQAADSGKEFTASDTAAANSVKVSTGQGQITQRELTIDPLVAKEAVKTYDGTTSWDTADAGKNITFVNVIGSDVLNARADAEFDDANAADSETEQEKTHTVTYKNITINNSNYKLADPDVVAQGSGVIHRAGLTVVADADTIRVSEPLPEVYLGTVTGWYNQDGADYADSFVFEAVNADNMKPGKYAVYGWYTNAQGDKVASGNYGKNYVFMQAPGNSTALTVEAADPGREYHDTVNPKSQFRPDRTAYEQASKDFVSGFNHGSSAALEYRDVNGAVIGTLTVGGSDTNTVFAGMTQQESAGRKGDIGITGAEVVNLDGLDAASSASIRIADSGEVVNLEIESIKPTVTAETADNEAEIAIERG